VKFWKALGRWFRRTFIAGILVVVPIGITVWILIWIFNSIDNMLRPLVFKLFGINVPGIGFGITVILIFVIGAIMSNVIGKRLVQWGEGQLGKIPILRQIYLSLREIFQSFSGQKNPGFLQVVLVEFPTKGMRSIGFITNETVDINGKNIINVFIPHAPNPMTGYMEIVGEESITRTNISIEDGLKMVVSAGRMSPKDLKEAMQHSPPPNSSAGPPR
jgi:uncharacterized membrane protein